MNCIACGREPTVEDTPLCDGCYVDIINGDAAAIYVIEQIEARYTEIIADLEGKLEEAMSALAPDRLIRIEVTRNEDGTVHHMWCECDACLYRA